MCVTVSNVTIALQVLLQDTLRGQHGDPGGDDKRHRHFAVVRGKGHGAGQAAGLRSERACMLDKVQ